jgi:hypothetical protein
MRYASIDALRTLAILLMIIVHFLENLSGASWAPGDLAAPLFCFLVGVSYRLWVHGEISKGRTDEQISSSTIRRGILIIVAGLLFNVVVWLPADTFNWDVLTLIGSAILLLGLIRDAPPVVPLFICVIVFVLAPILRIHSGYEDAWLHLNYDPEWSFPEVALGYIVNGYFPLFPWLVFPLAGFVAGECAVPQATGPEAETGPSWARVIPVVWAGLAFLAVEGLLYLSRALQVNPAASSVLGGWTMFPASVEYMTGMLGAVLILFGLSLWWIDGNHGLDRFPWALSFFRTMGQYSLSIYIFHHIIHLWPLWLYGVYTGHEATHYWREAMPWQAALDLALAAIVLMYLLFRWAEVGKRASLESLIRRLCE